MGSSIAQVVIGLVVLTGGAEFLVRGAVRLAGAVGISPLVIGLTVVAFGTSAPELAVSLIAAIGGRGDVALGNVVGSNIFNVLFILGLSALIVPLAVAQQLLRIEVPLLIGVSILVLVFGIDGRIGRLEGIVLFGLLIFYTAFSVRMSRRETREVREEYEREFGAPPESGRSSRGRIVLAGVLAAGGLALLVLGSHWFVGGAVVIAEQLGLGELVIGLTIVAAGTSLPEVATSIVAAVRGERDIAVGNVIGSNLFNLLCVLGLSGSIAPAGVPVSADALAFDLPVMLAVAFACLPIFATGHRISRWEGALFLLYQGVYTTLLILAARGHASLRTPEIVGLVFVVPLGTIAVASLFAHGRAPADSNDSVG